MKIPARPLKTKIISGARVSNHARMRSKNKLPYARRKEKGFFDFSFIFRIQSLALFFPLARITSTNGGIEDKIPDVSGRKISIFLQRKETEEEMFAPAFSREYDVSNLAMAG